MTQLPGDDGFDPNRDPNRNQEQDQDWPLNPRRRMEYQHGRHDVFSTRLIVGLLIILLGGTLLADNLGWFEARHVLRSLWPLALVAVGVAMIRHPQHRRSRAWGWVLVTVGFWIFADKIGWIHVSLGQLILPGILLFVGGVLVFRSVSGPPNGSAGDVPRAPGTPDTNGADTSSGANNSTGRSYFNTSFGSSQTGDTAEFVRSFAMLSGHELRPVSRPFRGADLSAIMGGIKLDLTSARMEGDSAVIEVFAFWGGVEIYVPPDWTVTSEVTTLLAGFIDKRRPTTVVPTKHLVIKGMIVMAGVEIKN
jgi:hypothetical protein